MAVKNIYIVGELYKPLKDWLLHDLPPTGMPAVYNLYQFLGRSGQYKFYSIIYNRNINRIKKFPNGSKIELIKLKIPNYYLWKFIVLIKIYFGSHKRLTSESFDLVYGLSTFAFVARRLGHKYKIKSAGRIYGTILTRLVKEKSYLKIYTRHFFDIVNIKFPPDEVICTQDGTQYDLISNNFNSPVTPRLMYNGMEANLRRDLLGIKHVTVLPSNRIINICQIARLHTYKRPQLSIQIIEFLVKKHAITNVRLTIVGDGPMKNELIDLINSKGLEKYIQLKDEISHDKIPSFLSNQDVALFFYHGGSLGNTYWECSLSGLLICTVDNGHTASVMQDNIHGIIKDDDDLLIERISSSLANYIGQDVSTMTQKNRNKVSHLIQTWDLRFQSEFQLLLGNPD